MLCLGVPIDLRPPAHLGETGRKTWRRQRRLDRVRDAAGTCTWAATTARGLPCGGHLRLPGRYARSTGRARRRSVAIGASRASILRAAREVLRQRSPRRSAGGTSGLLMNRDEIPWLRSASLSPNAAGFSGRVSREEHEVVMRDGEEHPPLGHQKGLGECGRDRRRKPYSTRQAPRLHPLQVIAQIDVDQKSWRRSLDADRILCAAEHGDLCAIEGARRPRART